MDTKELENEVIKLLNLNKVKEHEKKAIIDYVLGKTEKLNIASANLKLDFFSFWNLEKMLNTEKEELALRSYYVIALLKPDRFFTNTMHQLTAYSLYHKLNLDKQFVVENIWKQKLNVFYQRDTQLFKYIESRVSAYQKQKEKSLLGQAHQFYGGAFHSYLKSPEGQKAKDLPIKLYMQAMEIILQLDEEYENELEQLAETIENILSTIYANQSETMYVTYENGGRNVLQEVCTSLSFLFYKKSKKFKVLLKEQIEKLGYDYCEMLLNQVHDNKSTQVLMEILEELNVDSKVRVEYYAERMLRDPLMAEGQKYYQCIENIYKVEPEEVKEAYKELVREGNLGAVTLFAFLRLKGVRFEKDEINEIEGFLEITRRDIVIKFAEIRYLMGQQFNQVPLMLYEVSDKAKERIKELLENKEDYILSNMEMASKLFYKQAEENILEELTKYYGVNLVVQEAIERENPLSANTLRKFIKNHLEEVECLMNEKIKEGKDDIIKYVETLFTDDIGLSDAILMSVFNHRLKTVINFMEKFTSDKENRLRPFIQDLHKVKNKNMQEALQRLEHKWDIEKHIEALSGMTTIEEISSYIKEIYNPSNEKLIPYIDELDFNEVKDREGRPLTPILLKYYLSEYMLLKEMEILQPCEIIRSYLSERDLRSFMTKLYNRWLQDGADTKKKNIVFLYALSAGDSEINMLKKQIDLWTQNARGALAAFATTAMAVNGSSMALMLTDSIARKYKNKQVKAAAAAAMDYVAQVRGVSKEVLEDKIVPNLGFNAQREMTLSYGTRDFKLRLTPEMDITLFDEEKNKPIKSLPKPNASDDEEKALAAKETLKNLKKQLKTVITTQKQRLSKAILTGRKWTQENWKALFIDNPIMSSFAISLIWGEYSAEDVLLGTFRYMEDGSFNTIDEEEYRFQEHTFIRLIHPMDLGEEEKEAWKEQLKDYEITQSVMQLEMPIYTLTDEEQEECTLVRYKGEEVYYGKLIGVADRYEWQKTEALDAGCFEGFYYEDTQTNIGMLLRMDAVFMGMAPTDTAKIEELIFYQAQTADISYYYDEEAMRKHIIPLKKVPSKVLNLGLTVLELITKTKGEE